MMSQVISAPAKNWTVLSEQEENLSLNTELSDMMKFPRILNPRFQEWVDSVPLQEITCSYPDGGIFYMTRDTFQKFFGELGPQDDLYGKCEEAFGLSVTDTNLLTSKQNFNRSLYRDECEGKFGIESSNPPAHLLDLPPVKSHFDTRQTSLKTKKERSVDEEEEDVNMGNSEPDEFSHLVKRLKKSHS